MIDRSFVEKIVSLATPQIIKNDVGEEFSTGSISRIRPPSAAHITVYSLASFADYVLSISEEAEEKVFANVISPTEIHLISVLDGKSKTRNTYLHAECLYDPFQFGKKIDVEQFIIAIQAQFVQTETTASILKVVGNIVAGAEQKVLDDGVSQQVQARVGIRREEMASVPNPVVLQPYRTFIEIDQPASRFVFRMSWDGKQPFCSLHEADGGQWKVEAVDQIKGWMANNLAGKIKVI